MAKFFLTNNREWHDGMKERIQSSDYALSFDYAEDGIYALATHKLRLKNINAVKNADGDFVIATGTAIYKESLNYTDVVSDYVKHGIDNIRQNTIGQYAYVIKHNDAMTIFGDGFGAYNIYYYNLNGCYLISNSLYDIAKVLSKHISLNEMNLIEHSVQCAILCNETFFNEIRRLDGDEYIEINGGKMLVNALPEKWEILDGNAKQRAKELAQLLKKKASVISSVFGNPRICMTGGLDSRMSLAAYLSAGAKPTLFWGESNTKIASPEPMDKEIVHASAAKFGLKEQIDTWDTTHPDVEWEKYLNRYGFLYNLWGAAPDIMASFENKEDLFCTCGYGGELFRNLHLTEERKNDITIDALVQEYYMRHGKVTLDSEEAYKVHIEKKLQRIAKKYNLDPMHLKPEDITYFFIEYRSVADTITVNYLNSIGYSNMFLMEKDVVRYCRVRNYDMDKSRYMLEVLYDLYPQILDVPIFSHRTICRFDPKTMMLYSGIDTKRSRGALILKSIYNRAKGVLKPLRNLYKRMEHVERSEKPTYDILHANYKKTSNTLKTQIVFEPDSNLGIEYTMNQYAINTIL